MRAGSGLHPLILYQYISPQVLESEEIAPARWRRLPMAKSDGW